MFTTAWLIYSAFLVSSAQVVSRVDPYSGVHYKVLHWSAEAQRRVVVMVFCWIWTAAFIQASGQVGVT
jgi:hypothetical protein